MLIERPDL